MIQMDRETENLSYLQEISSAQEVMRTVLSQFRRNPEGLGGRLDSKAAVIRYYQEYYYKNLKKMSYPVTVEGQATDLAALLSGVPYGRPLGLRQAFRTAGKCFEAIENIGRISAVIPYDREAEESLASLERGTLSIVEQKCVLKKLQKYSVELFPYEKRKMENGIRAVLDGRLLVLDKRYYDEETGVTREPKPMEALFL